MPFAIVYSGVVAGEDEDPANATATQAECVMGALRANGWDCEHRKFDGNLPALADELNRIGPDFVFNLVESLLGTDRLAHIATGLYEHLGVPFAGSGSWGLLAAADKIVAKDELAAIGVASPRFVVGPDWDGAVEGRRYIVKAVAEHASLGIDDGAVVTGPAGIRARAAEQATKYFGARLFAEEYVDGREFNVAVLETADGPRVMPLAEMTFVGYPPDKPKIVDYAAKWREGSFEFEHTVRRFLDEAAEPVLAERLKAAALGVWRRFRLGGWARVDMRVGADGVPYVIDINVNPEISTEGGMYAAAAEAGLTYPQLIGEIVAAGLRRASA